MLSAGKAKAFHLIGPQKGSVLDTWLPWPGTMLHWLQDHDQPCSVLYSGSRGAYINQKLTSAGLKGTGCGPHRLPSLARGA